MPGTSGSEITRAIESNLFDLYRRVASLSGRPLMAGPRVSWVNCAPSRWPVAIFGANFDPDGAGEQIQSVKAAIRSGTAPNFWATGPSSRPENLGTLLIREGFQKAWDTAGMGMKLSDLEDGFEAPPGCVIETVADDPALRDWARVVTLGLLGCAESEVADFHALMKPVLRSGEVRLFLARHHGAPAASATLYLSGGIAGIYHVATLPEFRRRGFGLSITLAPLAEARKAGARAAILQATALGEPVYRRLGFRTYCTLARYRLAE
jgi:ribosomal protein S18 acetylase RimI-like enzyme